MKVATALAAAMLFIVPAAAFAQDTGEGGRGNDKSVGPASENRDTPPYGTAPSGDTPPQSQGQMGGDKGQ
jgi:hypothetical protein